MGLIGPSERGIQRFSESPDPGGRVVMLNLNRYRDASAYPAGSEHAVCSGREAYARYGAGVAPLLAKHGAKLLYGGAAGVGPILGDDEVWHDVLLVEYPSRAAFLAMTSSPEYLAVVEHRQAAIEDSRVIETRPPD